MVMDDFAYAAVVVVGVVTGRVVRAVPPAMDLGHLASPIVVRPVIDPADAHPREGDPAFEGLQLETTSVSLLIGLHVDSPG